MKKIDWDKVWHDYRAWGEPRAEYAVPWVKLFRSEEKKIQSLVEAQLRPKRRKAK